jgi:LuxR family quorum sensing-dependent transcriptional regulator
MAGLLTDRERDVMRRLAQGKTSWEVAAILEISERGVNSIVVKAMRKLGAVNRLHAVVQAIKSEEIAP